jgi:hypothetical protein
MTKKVLEVTEVTVELLKKLPPALGITAKGNVSSGGWSNGKLIPFVYKTIPLDGIYEFDFIADEPSDISTQVISEITSNEFLWDDFPQEVKGIRVYASENSIITFTKEKNESFVSDKELIDINTFPFNKVTPAILEKLQANNDSFRITNAFIWEDVLHISVRYGGGCKKHDFQLVWDGSLIKTNPTKIPLFLIHNNNGDNCKAIVSQDLQFSLSSHIKGESPILLYGWSKELTFKI